MDEDTRQGDTPRAHDGAGSTASAIPPQHSQSPAQRKARAGHYRCRAEELRAIADDVMLMETQRTLLSLADSYDHMASILDDVLLP
jgi:hypothetical protein